jgi:cytochrome c oxidase subunit 2
MAQCAEFCGLEHALMRLPVVGDDPAAFDAWATAQRRPAAEPAGGDQERGRELIERSACALCHSVTGTSAAARLGPDLTHVGSRPMLAAGALRNTPESMDRWLRDPQGVKPGNKMPHVGLTDADYRALVAYLGALK